MTILLIVVAVALTLLAVVQLFAPFFRSRRDQLRFEVLDEDLRQVEELVARRAFLLQQLRETQLDYETGKIDEEDYEDLRQSYELEAVEVLRELDDIHGGRGWQDKIDEELARRRDSVDSSREDEPAQSTQPDTEADKTTPTLDDDQASEGAVECPRCGKDMEADARFCSQCGHQFDDDDAGSSATSMKSGDKKSETETRDEVVESSSHLDGTTVDETGSEVAR